MFFSTRPSHERLNFRDFPAGGFKPWVIMNRPGIITAKFGTKIPGPKSWGFPSSISDCRGWDWCPVMFHITLLKRGYFISNMWFGDVQKPQRDIDQTLDWDVPFSHFASSCWATHGNFWADNNQVPPSQSMSCMIPFNWSTFSRTCRGRASAFRRIVGMTDPNFFSWVEGDTKIYGDRSLCLKPSQIAWFAQMAENCGPPKFGCLKLKISCLNDNEHVDDMVLLPG